MTQKLIPTLKAGTALFVFLGLSAFAGPVISGGGTQGKQFMVCQGTYKINAQNFIVDFNARITRGPNVGTVNSTSRTKTLTLNSELTENANDPRGYVYKGNSFFVLIPGNQLQKDHSTYFAILTAPKINNGHAIVLRCSN